MGLLRVASQVLLSDDLVKDDVGWTRIGRDLDLSLVLILLLPVEDQQLLLRAVHFR